MGINFIIKLCQTPQFQSWKTRPKYLFQKRPNDIVKTKQKSSSRKKKFGEQFFSVKFLNFVRTRVEKTNFRVRKGMIYFMKRRH